ncbi:Maleylacetate reductase [Skermanella stibiiresistens SB22]|uniref:Maleylacetate reductase n=1 Tax=Skermanella stibiiresistens SB22 TaxID=1385369 RepID=W9H0U2_9PROT|nr:maleylacetate reductase [Skermanella stibiiresistens]EWY38327.1 Maleylacetate reductase [Skermanella stibiiresistens SB22]
MTTAPFIHQSLPGRVVFGPGSLAHLPAEAERLGLRRVLVLSTPGQRGLAEEAARLLGDAAAGVHDRAVMHVPAETARAAFARVADLRADGCVAIGGGSTVGLGKAIALETGLPVIAVPTTYAGSEMTPIWGMTEGGLKTTGRDPRVLPRAVIYDPLLTLRLPADISGTSGINAIAHCVEALYSDTANPMTSLMAEEGVRALASSLPQVVRVPDDIAARSDALYGAWLGGSVLGTVGMAIHHKLCHTLGGTLNLPHAETHTIVLPHAASFNRDAAPEAMARVARALGVSDAPTGLFDLAVAVGAKTALKDIGMREDDIGRVANLVMRNRYHNPRPVTLEDVRALLTDAYHGVLNRR